MLRDCLVIKVAFTAVLTERLVIVVTLKLDNNGISNLSFEIFDEVDNVT